MESPPRWFPLRTLRLLLIEDSERLRFSLTTGLKKLGFAVDVAADGKAALAFARRNEYDVIVLDLLIPPPDGMTVLQTLRAEEHPARVLILSAKDAVQDRVLGLRHGADDYLTKPFSMDELVARIDALVRRNYDRASPMLEVGDLRIDCGARSATRGGVELRLSAREYRLLLLLALRAGETVTRAEIEGRLYDESRLPESNSVDSAVCMLRGKLEPPGARKLLHTRRGLGYVLAEDPHDVDP